MKKFIVFLTLIVLCVNTFSQQTNNTQKKTKAYYLAKSKRQKSAGWCLLGGGAAFILGGYLIGNSKEATFDDAGTGVVLAGLGVIAVIVSVPLFLSSSTNKRRGNNMTASIDFKHARTLHMQGLMNNYYPAVAIRIKL